MPDCLLELLDIKSWAADIEKLMKELELLASQKGHCNSKGEPFKL